MATFDSSAAISRGGAGQLLQIMTLDEALADAWKQSDRPAMLRHQMAAPLTFDLKALALSPAEQKKSKQALRDATTVGIKTFGNLFWHSRPPLDLLKLAKDFFKEKAGANATRRPQEEVAYLFYLLAIVAARVQLGVFISRLTDPELLRGVDWALAQKWLDEGTRRLFLGARELLGRRGEDVTPPV